MFSNGKLAVNVKTVAEAINELRLLPGDLRLDQEDDGSGTTITIFNFPDPENQHIEFGPGTDIEIWGDAA